MAATCLRQHQYGGLLCLRSCKQSRVALGRAVQDALADMPAMGAQSGAARGTPGGVPTPAAATPAQGTIRAAAEAARAAAPRAQRSLEPATIAAPAHVAQTDTPATTMSTPAAALRQPPDQAEGIAAVPERGSGSQPGAHESHAAAHTPPNLGRRGSGAPRGGSADAPTAAPVAETPDTGAAARATQAWASAAHMSQDSSPHVDATFGAGIAPGHAMAPERATSAAGLGAGAEQLMASGAAGGQAASGGDEQGVGAADAPRLQGDVSGARAETSRFASHLERLAAAIRQDEEVRNAQKASMEAAATRPHAAEGIAKVNMRAQAEEEEEPLEGSDGEFAADDDEEDCLATPPDARPETVFM